MTANNNGLHITLARKEGISNAQPERHTALRAAADALSLRNVDAAVCELMNEALARLVVLCYEQDAGGLCNMDAATGKILIPLPFGRNGHKRWGLHPQEADVLREILYAWEQDGSSLFRYDKTRRAWFVNLHNYANIHLAKQWLTRYQVTIAMYRAARSKRLGER